MRLVSLEDIRDIYIKAMQRGVSFLLKKFSFSAAERTKSSFNDSTLEVAYWHELPMVRKRWNYIITGDEDTTYEEYLTEKYFKNKKIRILSIGSGICSHELALAQLNPSSEITCIDFADKLLQKASLIADEKSIKNVIFTHGDIYKTPLRQEYYDVVFFHASLHHFKNIPSFLKRIKSAMKADGLIVINEYVGKNRLQYTKEQISAINDGLVRLPSSYKKIYRCNLHKNRYYGSGILRMIISDPSECVDSESILPTLRRLFNVLEEKKYGGNILMPLIKDIAHNFRDECSEKMLQCLFGYEDKYLETHQSDFIFGVYQKQH